jgi:hypothetical protein
MAQIRNITAFLCSMALSLPASLTAQDSPKNLTAAEVMQRVIAATGATPPADTVDTLKAGDPNTVVTGIVTTFMDTYPVLEKAVASRKNLITRTNPRSITIAMSRRSSQRIPCSSKSSRTSENTTWSFTGSTTPGICAGPTAFSSAWSTNSDGNLTRAAPTRSFSGCRKPPSAGSPPHSKRARAHALSALSVIRQ